MKRYSLAFFFLPLVAFAEDMTLRDGTLLQQAELLRKGDDYLQILHKGGVRRVQAAELTDAQREKYGMTEQILGQLEQQRKDEESSRREDLRRQNEQARARMEAAGQQPRYLSAEDMQRLMAPLEELSPDMAAYLAAEWNRREAARLNLAEETAAYAREAALKQASFSAGKEAFLAECRSEGKARARVSELEKRLAESKERYAQLQADNKELRSSLSAAESRAAFDNGPPAVITRTVPVFVPVGSPRPRPGCPLPPRPPRPCPPKVR